MNNNHSQISPQDADTHALKILKERLWHFTSIGMGNCRAAQRVRREVEQHQGRSGTGVSPVSFSNRTGADARATIDQLTAGLAHLESVGLANSCAAQFVRAELSRQLMIQSALLANTNFNPNEPRDSLGRWTDDLGKSAGAALKKGMQALVRFYFPRKPAGELTISRTGLDLIAKFEGFKAHQYQDQALHWTIGFGHKMTEADHTTYTNGITREQALNLLCDDVAQAEQAVQNAVKVPISQLEFDALVSFAYNEGGARLRGSTLLKKLNQNDRAGAADEFSKWIYAGGKRSDGLVERRREEQILFKEEVGRFKKELGISHY